MEEQLLGLVAEAKKPVIIKKKIQAFLEPFWAMKITLDMWPYLGKPGIWDLHAIGAMHVFSTLGRKLPKFNFCHIHVEEPFY